MKIAIAGAGYVGFSLAVLLGRTETVTLVDPNEDRVRIIQNGGSPIYDRDIEQVLGKVPLHISAATDGRRAYREAELIVVAVPTDFDELGSTLKTDVIDTVLQEVCALNPSAPVVIKSTVPVGFTRSANRRFGARVLFSPEFLRENTALRDNLEPDRIVVGYPGEFPGLRAAAEAFAALLLSHSERGDAPCLITDVDEAEAIKLFSNTFLAMRVSFFNELDSFAQSKGLDARKIIAGVSGDRRIGNYYNNPSFGYGGYCLPKDSKHLCRAFGDIPASLIPAVVEANDVRKRFIVEQIVRKKPGIVGVYRLSAKAGSDNCRNSSVRDVVLGLVAAGIRVMLYEPLLSEPFCEGTELVSELDELLQSSDIILANRYHPELDPVREKVFTRDLFARD